jgi:hypothetical protein
MHNDVLVVISHYAGRQLDGLNELITQISVITKNILIVINSDLNSSEHKDFYNGFPVIIRPNTGMNIGAWNSAFENYPDYKFYIFLQDECSVVRPDFLDAYKKELSLSGVGMTGESINFKWDISWQRMLQSPLNYLTDFFSDGHRLSRVEYYLRLLGAWKIYPGSTGRHLRALVWGFNQSSLSQLNGFPLGSSKEECIASEIAVSKKIEELGLRVTQISSIPFYYFKHQEWRVDGASKNKK